ncbi:hypothetical protein M9Y10_036961 [Tritrichomonas musculus]|uniref:Viral A-type inclusion protein n=1 Tax=Tritrichomonas musculus TaxID=1915356 RepID=A0ABR2GTD9_9EUKA
MSIIDEILELAETEIVNEEDLLFEEEEQLPEFNDYESKIKYLENEIIRIKSQLSQKLIKERESQKEIFDLHQKNKDLKIEYQNKMDELLQKNKENGMKIQILKEDMVKMKNQLNSSQKKDDKKFNKDFIGRASNLLIQCKYKIEELSYEKVEKDSKIKFLEESISKFQNMLKFQLNLTDKELITENFQLNQQIHELKQINKKIEIEYNKKIELLKKNQTKSQSNQFESIDIKNENFQLKKKIDDLVYENRCLKSNTKPSRDESGKDDDIKIASLEENLLKLQERIQNKENELIDQNKNLIEKNRELELKNINLQDEFQRSISETNREKEQKINELNDQIINQKAKENEFINQIKILSKNIDDLNEINQNLKNDFQRAINEKNQENEKLIQQLNEKLITIQSSQKVKENELTNQNEKLIQKNHELEDENKNLRIEFQRLIDETNRENEEKIKQLNESFVVLQNDQKSKENELINQNEKLSQQVQELSEMNQNLKSEFQQSVDEFNQESVDKIAAMEADLSQIRNLLKIKEKSLKLENVQLVQKYTELETQSKKIINGYKLKIEKLNQVKKDDDQKIKFLEENLANVQNQLKLQFQK